MYDQDYDIEEQSFFKRVYKKFDRLDPFGTGFLCYVLCSIVISFAPYGMSEMKSAEPATFFEALNLIWWLGLAVTFPPLMFVKGVIQSRMLPLCIIGLCCFFTFGMIHVAQLLQALDTLVF